MIWEEILGLAVSNGIFAVLFVLLLFYQLKDSRNREQKYQNTIEKLNIHLDEALNMKEDISEVKNMICFKLKEKKSEEKDKAV